MAYYDKIYYYKRMTRATIRSWYFGLLIKLDQKGILKRKGVIIDIPGESS